MNQCKVTLLLSDSAPSSFLKDHYTLDRKFRKLWLERREENNHQFIPIEFSNDKYFLLKFIRKHNRGSTFPKALEIFEQIPPSLQKDEEIFIEFFVSFCLAGKKLSHQLTEELVVKLAKRYYLSDIIKIGSVKKELVNWINCRNVILECLRNRDSEILSRVSMQFRKDRELMMESIIHEPLSIKYADKSLHNDREFVFEAVKRNGRALESTFSFFNDREMVLEAVKTYPEILKYANPSLQEDFEVVMQGIKTQASCIKYASINLKNDRNILMESVSRNGTTLQHASDLLRNDRELVFKAVEQNGIALKYASDELKNDRELVTIAIRKNPEMYEFLSSELKHDLELARFAVSKNPYLVTLLPSTLQQDAKVQELIHQYSYPKPRTTPLQNAQKITQVRMMMNSQNFEKLLVWVRSDGSLLEYLDKHKRENKLIQIEAVKSNGFYLKYSRELFDIRIKEAYQNIHLDLCI